MDKRGHTRNSVRISVELFDGSDTPTRFVARDFSPTGALLEREDPSAALPQVGSVVQLKIIWPLETHIPPVEVEANVARHTDNGIGVSFQIK